MNKKSLLFLLPILISSILIGCNNKEASSYSSLNSSDISTSESVSTSIDNSTSNITPGENYEITYKDGLVPYLYGDNPYNGKPGSKIEIKTNIIYDADLILYAYLENGLDFFNETLTHEDFDDYWLFSFMMPGCPVTIDYEIISSPEPSYVPWPTQRIQTLTDGLIGETSEVIPSYDYASGIEIDFSLKPNEYFGIYCYVSNGYLSEEQYIDKLNNSGWDTSDTKIEGFYESYSPNKKIWLNFKYDDSYEDLEIYVTKAPIKSWPTDLIKENLEYIVENTSTVIPSFEAELYVVNYYAMYETLAINGYGVKEDVLTTYKAKVEQLGWETSNGVNEGDIDAISPNKDIKITFYYVSEKNEFNIDVQKKIEDSSSWPKEALKGMLNNLGLTGEIMEYKGEYSKVEVDDNPYYPVVIIYVDKGTELSSVAAYNQMLLDNGYVKVGQVFGEDVYNHSGDTVMYRAAYLQEGTFTLEIFDINSLSI